MYFLPCAWAALSLVCGVDLQQELVRNLDGLVDFTYHTDGIIWPDTFSTAMTRMSTLDWRRRTQRLVMLMMRTLLCLEERLGPSDFHGLHPHLSNLISSCCFGHVKGVADLVVDYMERVLHI